MRNSKINSIALSVIVLMGTAVLAEAHSRTVAPPPPDRITVIAQVPHPGGSVAQLTSGVHWRRNYLYVDYGFGKPVEILDVTDPQAPKAAGTLDVPNPQANGTFTAVVGTAALVASSAPPARPQTISIMSFADREHPQLVQQFPGVTAMLKDSGRGLVYLADGTSLWVLQLQPATDVELDKDYDHYIQYTK